MKISLLTLAAILCGFEQFNISLWKANVGTEITGS